MLILHFVLICGMIKKYHSLSPKHFLSKLPATIGKPKDWNHNIAQSNLKRKKKGKESKESSCLVLEVMEISSLFSYM